MNTIATYGRIASDVTTNDVNGRTVANFRFASPNKRKEKDGKYGTNWYNVAAWGPLGDTASKYLKKGHRATVSGELVVRQYVGNDNVTHTVVEIDADTIDLVETKAEAESKSSAPAQVSAAAAPAQSFTPVETDELPF
jgi:single-strand DNA-binding protein